MSEEDKVLPTRVERYTSVNDPARPTQLTVDPVPAPANREVVDQIHDETVVAPTAAPVSPEAELGKPVEFHLNGQVGQFFLLRDHWVTEPEHSRAILDTVWPLQVREIPESENGPAVLHFVAFCPLFRKVAIGEQIPPYVITTADGPEGIEVFAEEQPMPEKPKIVVPRKDRREMERFAARERKLQLVQP